MPFSQFGLHPDLLRGVKELGFTRPTPIQADAIPPAMAGRDVLACAMTGSGKTAAFLLPILHQLIGKPRGTTRALVLTPTRELAAQIHEHLERARGAHAAHRARRSSAASAWGRRSTPSAAASTSSSPRPGRLLDHFRVAVREARPASSILVLDEADRMLDMGFLPDIRRVLQPPARRSGRRCSSARRCRRRSSTLTREMLHDPGDDQPRAQGGAGGRHHAGGLPGAAGAEVGAAARRCSKRGEMQDALVFTRTKHRANRLAEYLVEARHQRPSASTATASQAQRTEALAGFKSGKYRVLVATDIAARGIDVEALGHVVNFDVPDVPEDYIHRVGRTARAEATGDAFTFVSPEEEGDLRAIERAIGKRLPRVTRAGLRLQRARRPSGSRFRSPSASPRSARARPRSGRAPRRRPSGASRTRTPSGRADRSAGTGAGRRPRRALR